MNTISKERREELRAIADLNPFAVPEEVSANEILALLDNADELEAIKADEDIGITGSDELDSLKAERQTPDPVADLPRAERNEPHAPTVAAALREWVRVAHGYYKGRSGCATLEEALERHADEMEGREDG
jgi:hypothetical protein